MLRTIALAVVVVAAAAASHLGRVDLCRRQLNSLLPELPRALADAC
jgi:hypothetical protein